jgi:hypothetical protein
MFGPAFAAETEPGGMVGAMKAEERYPFVAGIIEGIAYHRYVLGEKDTAAMNCVYDWFYKGDGTGRKTIEIIYLALAEYPDHPPAAVIVALANKKCGS